MTRVGWLATVVIAVIALAPLAAVIVGGAPLVAPPGVVDRLTTYFTRNEVRTEPGSRFPERRPMQYRTDVATTLRAAREVATTHGWRLTGETVETPGFTAVAVTPILRFRDDVTVAVHPTPDGGSVVSFQSASRLGRGDLGANTARLIAFRRDLDARLPEASATAPSSRRPSAGTSP